MNLIVSDRSLQHPLPFDKQQVKFIDLSRQSISNCIGCFGCWVKTPGKCVIRDDAPKIYPLIAQSTHLLYISRICFGGYDTPMKTLLERTIPIQKAFIRLYHGETHHVQRRVAPKNAVIIAYGSSDPQEQELFQRLVARNANNMQFHEWKVVFVSEDDIDAAVKKEVSTWIK